MSVMTSTPTTWPRPRTTHNTVMVVATSQAEQEAVASAGAVLAWLTNARLVLASTHEWHPDLGSIPYTCRGITAGPLDRVVAALARQETADLIVIGTTPRREGRSHARLARRLLDAGRCVLAVSALHPPGLSLTRIGLGYDGSRSAEGALRAARHLADLASGTVSRVDIAYVDDSFDHGADADTGTLDTRRSALVAWWLEELGEDLAARVCPLRLVGDAASELTDLSHDLDLLIVGSRGRAPLSRLLTGSVSSCLIAESGCPVLVVPAPSSVERRSDDENVARRGADHVLCG
jgi:nucleotide-binding universal stress UspA family protein